MDKESIQGRATTKNIGRGGGVKIYKSRLSVMRDHTTVSYSPPLPLSKLSISRTLKHGSLSVA